MKKLFISALVIASALCSCNNDTDIDLFSSQLVEQGAGTLTNTGTFINWLEFAWQPIDGVYQYGYKLSDANGKAVRQGITKKTTIKFERLEVNQQYTLQIEAYGQNGELTQRFEISAKTDAIQQLAAVDMAQAVMSVEGKAVTIEWPAVDNAEYYDYQLLSDAAEPLLSGSVAANSVVFNSLPNAEYTLCVTANSDNEAYAASEAASYDFVVDIVTDGPNYTAQARTVAYDYWEEGTDYEGRFSYDGTIAVDVYDDYVLIKGWLGDNEQCIKVAFDKSGNVVSLTPIDNGIEGKTYTKNYASFYTGSAGYYAVDIYLGKYYDYAFADSNGGYVRLSGYFYDYNDNEPWMYYNLEW